MLHLVTKERFEEWCKGKKPNHTIRKKLDEHFEWHYYEIQETDSWLLYFEELGRCFVFGEVPTDYSVTFEDWRLEQIGEKPNPKYILNIMKACVYLDDDFYKKVGTGEWKITNTRFLYSIDFSIKICGNYYHQTAIGYEEKLRTPINKAEIRLKNTLIESIKDGIRGYNKNSSE